MIHGPTTTRKTTTTTTVTTTATATTMTTTRTETIFRQQKKQQLQQQLDSNLTNSTEQLNQRETYNNFNTDHIINFNSGNNLQQHYQQKPNQGVGDIVFNQNPARKDDPGRYLIKKLCDPIGLKSHATFEASTD